MHVKLTLRKNITYCSYMSTFIGNGMLVGRSICMTNSKTAQCSKNILNSESMGLVRGIFLK